MLSGSESWAVVAAVASSIAVVASAVAPMLCTFASNRHAERMKAMEIISEGRQTAISNVIRDFSMGSDFCTPHDELKRGAQSILELLPYAPEATRSKIIELHKAYKNGNAWTDPYVDKLNKIIVEISEAPLTFPKSKAPKRRWRGL